MSFQCGLSVFEAISGVFGATAQEPLAFAARSELFEGIDPGRLNETEARNGGVEVYGHQRFCDQIGQALDDILRREIRVRCNAPSRFEVERAGENADPAIRWLFSSSPYFHFSKKGAKSAFTSLSSFPSLNSVRKGF